MCVCTLADFKHNAVFSPTQMPKSHQTVPTQMPKSAVAYTEAPSPSQRPKRGQSVLSPTQRPKIAVAYAEVQKCSRIIQVVQS
jgi:hypothetical protein